MSNSWLNEEALTGDRIAKYREHFFTKAPKHIVIDDLFDTRKLKSVLTSLQDSAGWQTQYHSYDALYVDSDKWQQTTQEDRFVKRDLWCFSRGKGLSVKDEHNLANEFLAFLRSEHFMAFLSQICNVKITDINVSNPDTNTSYFRLNSTDFVNPHADDSPGRVMCLLLYLNEGWKQNNGGELVFSGRHSNIIEILPTFNRCVLFDPTSKGSEHWVKTVNHCDSEVYRYNVTSWYWSV